MNLESHVAGALAAVLAPLPPGTAIPDSERFGDLQLALERFVPHLLGWCAESLDGFRFCVARKLGRQGAEFIGVALLISDQAWTPIWLRIRLSERAEGVAAIDCRLGERGNGVGGLLRIPYGSNRLTKLLFSLPARVTDVAWAYEAKRGDLADTAIHHGGKRPRQNEVDRPFDDFKRPLAGQISHEDYQAHFDLGVAYAEMGLLDDAVSEFELVLHAVPDHLEARAAHEAALARKKGGG